MIILYCQGVNCGAHRAPSCEECYDKDAIKPNTDLSDFDDPFHVSWEIMNTSDHGKVECV